MSELEFTEISKRIENLNLDESKLEKLQKKPIILKHLSTAITLNYDIDKTMYSLCCTAPSDINIKNLAKLVQNKTITREGLLKGLIKNKITEEDDILEFLKVNTVSDEETKNRIDEMKLENKTKNGIIAELKKEMPYADFKLIMCELSDYDVITDEEGGNGLENENFNSSKRKVQTTKRDWLAEGEMLKLKAPSENTQRSPSILNAHLERTKGAVVTRFPPEPNGYLHIGHAKALNISFEYAKKYGGYTYFRYDDTNPRNENELFYNSILEDVMWLGFEPYKVTASSDYFEEMLEMSKTLIKQGDAYVCFLSNEEVKNRRVLYQKQNDMGNHDPTILSPYRNTPANINTKEFEKMLNGGYADGMACLRFKMDLKSRNPLMLDLVAARIVNAVHIRRNKNFIVYPTYEFALCVADSVEDVTHSFCSREFYTRQEPYHWLLRKLGLYEPVQWEFSRLSVSNTVLSKRKLTKIVKTCGIEWDDPRFYTISGMRRRGFPPEAINKFAQSVGITFSESVIDIKSLENIVRNCLYTTSKMIFVISDPIKVYINLKKAVKFDDVEFNIENCIYIDGEDFSDDPHEDYLRLTPNNSVGLLNLGKITFTKKVNDGIVCEFQSVDDENFTKPSKFIQWLPHIENKAELRLYSPLFKSFNPCEVDYLTDLDVEGSLKLKTGYFDDRGLSSEIGNRFQFVRKGFYCVDPDTDTSVKHYVFNRTLTFKSSFK